MFLLVTAGDVLRQPDDWSTVHQKAFQQSSASVQCTNSTINNQPSSLLSDAPARRGVTSSVIPTAKTACEVSSFELSVTVTTVMQLI